ncbi:MAG: FAD-binding protein [Anaerolineales bacterium]|nr:FAD-binding protein [Anaerolineales bacterium]MDW8278240.1 FAD-linked oxidase C-terminal domain-containing protein [Anaerolineales bacterium]
MSLPPDFLSELQKHFHGEIRLDRVSRILYSTDASIYQMEPLGVVIPRHQEDLHAVVELAARYRVPVLPRGSGSSLAGQAVGRALILDVSRYLDHILEINPETRTATVEPGVILAALNRAAARHGLQFGPDPASAERATIGGVVGNNATGAHSILYGMTADHLLSAEVILADGSLATWGEIPLTLPPVSPSTHQAQFVRTLLTLRQTHAEAIRTRWPHSWRNSAGYRLNYLLPWSPSAPPLWEAPSALYAPQSHAKVPDTINLAPLLAGSEGTLAVIRRVTLNLVPRPRHTVLALLQYESIPAACDDVPRLLQHHPSAVELVPQLLIRLARGVPAYAAQMDFVEGDPAALLIVEFSGEDPVELERRARQISADASIAVAPQAQTRIWNVRKVGLGIFDSRPAAARPVAFIEDCAIPVEHLGDFVREVERILAEHATTSAIYAHASAGCLHIRPLLDLRTGPGVRALRSIAEQVLALTLRLGGSMSSEHGDGLARSEWLRATYGDDILQAFAALKHAADPYNLLNPGKIVSPPPMDTHLRYRQAAQPSTWSPVLHFEAGLATAIEQCNGQGVCRKQGGIMCPSFQATREEMHSTRGRANLLRALILAAPTLSQQSSPSDSFVEIDAVKQALDLCLACKGCKAECPSGVDMAKLKYEFQNHYYSTRRRPLRDYLFAYINQIAPLGVPFAPLINRVARWQWFRRLTACFGITEHRPLPRFGKRSTWPRVSPAARERVLYLPDTFTRFFEPEVEAAALRVLAALEIAPLSLPILGAGRTLLSKGFLEPARLHAETLLEAIRRLDPRGELPVIGLEPSEIYTLRDELRDLLPARRLEAEALAARACMIDEYLVRPGASTGAPRVTALPLSSARPTASVLLHGHCYQKAQPPAADGYPVGQEATAALLRAIGYQVEIVPSGCCGMAGAFGYESEHYELSRQVGELVLLPAVRQAKTEDRRIVAAGTSCRSQIHDGAQTTALHPIQLVAERLKFDG